MRKQNAFIGFILIAVGIYFTIHTLNIPMLRPYYSWTMMLILIGICLVLYSYFKKDYDNLLISIIILGLGIHFFGLENFDFWIDHWAIYLLIIGSALIIRSLRIKKGLFSGLVIIIVSLLFIFPIQLTFLNSLDPYLNPMRTFWPVLLIVVGLYLIIRKK